MRFPSIFAVWGKIGNFAIILNSIWALGSSQRTYSQRGLRTRCAISWYWYDMLLSDIPNRIIDESMCSKYFWDNYFIFSWYCICVSSILAEVLILSPLFHTMHSTHLPSALGMPDNVWGLPFNGHPFAWSMSLHMRPILLSLVRGRLHHHSLASPWHHLCKIGGKLVSSPSAVDLYCLFHMPLGVLGIFGVIFDFAIFVSYQGHHMLLSQAFRLKELTGSLFKGSRLGLVCLAWGGGWTFFLFRLFCFQS